MDIDDLFDGILDENPIEGDENPKESNYEWLFPIKGYKSSTRTHFENGTGFFVNNDGFFITAGHVLSNNELDYKAILNDEEFDFEVLFREYVCLERQEQPFCKDLAICRVDIQKDVAHYFSTKHPNNQTVQFSGFSRNLIYGGQFDSIKRGDLYLQHGKGIDEKSVIPRFEDVRPICMNTRSLKLTEGIRFNGLSGGPVYDGKSIYGMFIGIEYILSEYIIGKLCQLGVSVSKIHE